MILGQFWDNFGRLFGYFFGPSWNLAIWALAAAATSASRVWRHHFSHFFGTFFQYFFWPRFLSLFYRFLLILGPMFAQFGRFFRTYFASLFWDPLGRAFWKLRAYILASEYDFKLVLACFGILEAPLRGPDFGMQFETCPGTPVAPMGERSLPLRL